MTTPRKKLPNESHRHGIPKKMIDFLTSYGFIFWRHYRSVKKAQALANSLRLELARQIVMRAFNGWVKPEIKLEWCHDRCKGWDGEAETCDCGTYEVQWELTGSWQYGTASVRWRYKPSEKGPRAQIITHEEVGVRRL